MGAGDPTIIPEEGRRLSQCALWGYQSRYFREQGIRAWNESEVPHYVTSNPWIAAAYARVVLAWFRDWSASGGIDVREPVYIIEIGCGNGRFGYLFVRRLLQLLDSCPLGGIDFRYVYTDVAEYNLDVLSSHESLQPLIEAGVVDFALFDAESSGELRLKRSQEILAPGSLRNPLAVIANYVFDGIPQDCFRIESGQLLEGRVHLTLGALNTQGAAADAISSAAVAFDYRVITGDYYEDASWNRILNSYTRLPGDSTLLFPCSALTCIARLSELSGERLLLLSADKGLASEESLTGRGDPFMNIHGSFSFMVNYHAIGEYVSGRGGDFLRSSHKDTSLAIVACLLGDSAGGYPETRLAYDDFIEAQGPDDFFVIKRLLQGRYEGCTPEQLVAVLRFSGWDHTVFLSCYEGLRQSIAAAGSAERQMIADVLNAVWEHHFPLRESGDVALYIGILFLHMDRPGEALEFLAHSARRRAPDATAAVYAAFGHAGLLQWTEALENATRALELDPGNQAAQCLVAEIEEIRSNAGGQT